MYNINWNIHGKVFLPYNRHHHWCLLILDFDDHTIMHLDPKREHGWHDENAVEMFRRFLAECYAMGKTQLTNINWKVKKFY